ncbi:hypothetical protein DM860_016079 [Cuscuta australis]|uniref:cellulase n=1 Tax=Cuscuta australis TaxID=267555 RepID=A0A328E3U3_9ASTE|nr:hypothetical protein DM860_016079 [Cuscuta australis]
MKPYLLKVVAFLALITILRAADVKGHDYGDALSKSILFFEGQRSGKLPSTQRMTWRKDSALHDGSDWKVDLVGGYYDAGDNVKYSFPMAFTTTMLAWSVVEYGGGMGGAELPHALEAIRWATDFLMKATSEPNVVYIMVGDPNSDHNCWERPEDMDTPRTSYQVNVTDPGSEVSAEIAAALAASSIAFKDSDPSYSKSLLQRAAQVFEFADKFRSSYNYSTKAVCPFYCDFSGYEDELLWGAAWLYKATNDVRHLGYVTKNINKIWTAGSSFGWDSKHAGINVLLSKYALSEGSKNNLPFISNADTLVCAVLPESPLSRETFTPGGLIYQKQMVSMQRPVSLSFLLVTYATYLGQSKRTTIDCDGKAIPTSRLIEFAKSQVDYILGNNPMKMSYMVGYGDKYPQRIQHRGSSLPSIEAHPQHIGCKDGTPYFQSPKPNPNILIGALVGGPNDGTDHFPDDRVDAGQSEPVTYLNAPFVGLLAYLKANSH